MENPEKILEKAVEGISGSLAQLRYLRSSKDEAKVNTQQFDEAIAKVTESLTLVAKLEVK